MIAVVVVAVEAVRRWRAVVGGQLCTTPQPSPRIWVAFLVRQRPSLGSRGREAMRHGRQLHMGIG